MSADAMAKVIVENINFSEASPGGKTSLECITPFELGFRGFAHQALFYARAEASGLSTLTAYRSALIRLNYVKQPSGEILYLGMDPVRLPDGKRAILCLHSPDENNL